MAGLFRRTFYLPRNIPVFTGLVIFVCCVEFALYHLTPTTSPAWLGLWGDFSIWDIYNGRQIWALLTGTLVHHEPLHIFFNLYWVWFLGRVLEEEIGTLNFLFFWLAAALFSSACQLAFGSGPGIGASGVVYAIFGYEFASRDRVERFATALDGGKVRFFLIWLFICLFLTWTKVMSIGNAAHFSGFGFGYAMGYLIVVRQWLQLALSSALALTVLSLGSAYYAPWSSWWCAAEGFRKMERDPAAALVWFARVSPGSPVYSYVLPVRAEARGLLGDSAGAIADLENALAEVEEGPNREILLNSLAWDYATDSNAKNRNPAKALKYAKEVCELTHWKIASYIDTLAAAYAANGDFDNAVEIQEKALEVGKGSLSPDHLKGLEEHLALYRERKPFVETKKEISGPGL